jgi:hypothetical protein
LTVLSGLEHVTWLLAGGATLTVGCAVAAAVLVVVGDPADEQWLGLEPGPVLDAGDPAGEEELELAAATRFWLISCCVSFFGAFWCCCDGLLPLVVVS